MRQWMKEVLRRREEKEREKEKKKGREGESGERLAQMPHTWYKTSSL